MFRSNDNRTDYSTISNQNLQKKDSKHTPDVSIDFGKVWHEQNIIKTRETANNENPSAMTSGRTSARGNTRSGSVSNCNNSMLSARIDNTSPGKIYKLDMKPKEYFPVRRNSQNIIVS